MTTAPAREALGQVVARGNGLTAQLVEAVTGANLSLSLGELTQFTLAVADPGLRILESRLLHSGGALDWWGLPMEVAVLEPGQGTTEQLTVTARSLVGLKMKRATGALVEANTTPTEFMARRVAAAGGKFVGEPSAGRPQVGRKAPGPGEAPESDWDVGQRLATELGYIAGEAAGTYYFGRPSWLMGRAVPWRVAWPGHPRGAAALRTGATETITLPTCRRSEQAPEAATVEAAVPWAAGVGIRPGAHRLELAGVPTFEGAYLITGVTIEVDGTTPVTIAGATPVDPTPQPPEADAAGSPDAEAAELGGPRSALEFVRVAEAQAGDRYVYGAEAAVSDPDPHAFDCSELVQWAAGRAGVTMVDGSAAQLAYCRRKGTEVPVAEAINTRGALLFAKGHVAISRGDGTTIEARGRKYGVCTAKAAGRPWIAGARVPDMRYG